MNEINETIYRWIQNIPKKRIASSLGMSVNTIKKIIKQVEKLGFKKREIITDQIETISQQLKSSFKNLNNDNQTAQISISLYHEQISDWMKQDNMTKTQMIRLLSEQDFNTSYSSLSRYISKHFSQNHRNYTIPLHAKPGQEAQVDFCSVGMMLDPIKNIYQKAYAFVMTLSFSRYRFVRFVFSQNSYNWIDCHIRAFNFFGGVPSNILIDNLKTGVIKADLYDPTINKSYAECERHYGFVVDTAIIRMAKHKGKVERNMSIVRQQILAGRNHADINEANQYAEKWCRYDISQRVTRTTGKTPWELFNEEKQHLKTLPKNPYDYAFWQHALVHRDHHVTIEGSFYSLPTIYIGKKVWVRIGHQNIQIFLEDQMIKFHPRAIRKGTWVTDQQDYPEASRKFLDLNKEYCRKTAAGMGNNVLLFITPSLEKLSKQNQRKILAIFNLAEKYGKERLDAACARALHFGNNRIDCIKNILRQKLEEEKKTDLDTNVDGMFLRQPEEFINYH